MEQSTINLKLIKDILSSITDEQLCTAASDKKFIKQRWFHCLNCKLLNNLGVCAVCIKTCHKDHRIFYAGFTQFFCDCGDDNGSMSMCIKKK